MTNSVPNSLARVTELAKAVAAAPHERALAKAVRPFVAFLQTIPDSAAAEWSHDSLAAVRNASEDVVEAIEQLLERTEAAGASERRLAEQIYAIRRALENIDHWERHFLGRGREGATM
jgi:hypothetical protein